MFRLGAFPGPCADPSTPTHCLDTDKRLSLRYARRFRLLHSAFPSEDSSCRD
jgi:hypothetical protein